MSTPEKKLELPYTVELKLTVFKLVLASSAKEAAKKAKEEVTSYLYNNVDEFELDEIEEVSTE